MKGRSLLIILPTSLVVCSAFVPSPLRNAKSRSTIRPSSAESHGPLLLILAATAADDGGTNSNPPPSLLSRKSFGATVFGSFVTGFAALCSAPTVGVAASSSTEKEDKAKILKGYERLSYLLDNWEAETTICNSSNDNPYIGCERNPMKVMEYLGYKSTTDPLFRADKTLIRLEAYVPNEYASEYQDALDRWVEKADEANGIAYVSSWGESNPGGGKDRVEYFIERSKKDVLEARDCLGTVVKILDLK